MSLKTEIIQDAQGNLYYKLVLGITDRKEISFEKEISGFCILRIEPNIKIIMTEDQAKTLLRFMASELGYSLETKDRKRSVHSCPRCGYVWGE